MTGAVTRGTKATKTKNLTKRLNSLISNYQDKTGHRIVITKDGQARVFFSQRGAPPYFSSPFENVDSVRLRDHSGGLAREIESIVRELKNAGAG